MGVTSRGQTPGQFRSTIRREVGQFEPFEAHTVIQTTPSEGPPAAPKPPERGDRMKLDHGKAPWHLAPWDAFLAIVMVLAFGAAKYRPNGWREGMAYSRLFSAAQRHLTAWWMREGKDPETGFSHLAHAATCVCFLIAYELDARLRTHDDRPERTGAAKGRCEQP